MKALTRAYVFFLGIETYQASNEIFLPEWNHVKKNFKWNVVKVF